MRFYDAVSTQSDMIIEGCEGHHPEFEKYRLVQDRLFESDFDKLVKSATPVIEDRPVRTIAKKKTTKKEKATKKKRIAR